MRAFLFALLLLAGCAAPEGEWRYRDNATGQFVTETYAHQHPFTTKMERVR